MSDQNDIQGMNEVPWDEENTGEMHMFEGPRFRGNFRNKRYNDAYGDYSGGYGPRRYPLGFGPGPGPDFWARPPPPPFLMGRGFGPGGPPMRRYNFDDKAIKYLMRCGLAKESVKNLPRELLLLMEPHNCGLCGHTFDSFASSRLHYVSKNHQKCQKRWLSQNSETGGFPHKEAPLRARELYCELCDVHITSKAHADSHYSGKPHRAIVEGRKNPKNGALLQRNMEDRLVQLIRREKKHLKAAAKNDKPEDKTEVTKEVQEKKFLQSELFCDICKTSVTCTEQMTMHLNGKKHLNKEKQHILKMMKIDATATTEKNEDEVIADAKDGNENETNDDEVSADAKEGTSEANGNGEGEENGAAKENGAGDFDWGNGGGTWDEPGKDQ